MLMTVLKIRVLHYFWYYLWLSFLSLFLPIYFFFIFSTQIFCVFYYNIIHNYINIYVMLMHAIKNTINTIIMLIISNIIVIIKQYLLIIYLYFQITNILHLLFNNKCTNWKNCNYESLTYLYNYMPFKTLLTMWSC
jgi:hypothetical protein